MATPMSRYVILEHDWPARHWDLMLEAGDGLRTWRLESPPTGESKIGALELGNHRTIYLEYEGPLSGDRGQVIRWDHGRFEWRHDSPDRVAVELTGKRCTGLLELKRIAEGKFLVSFCKNQAT
jgi:hypothetical protein